MQKMESTPQIPRRPSGNPSGICRFCFSQYNVRPLFPISCAEGQTLLEQIRSLLLLDLGPARDADTAVCDVCRQQLMMFQLFRDRSQLLSSAFRSNGVQQVVNQSIATDVPTQDLVNAPPKPCGTHRAASFVSCAGGSRAGTAEDNENLKLAEALVQEIGDFYRARNTGSEKYQWFFDGLPGTHHCKIYRTFDGNRGAMLGCPFCSERIQLALNGTRWAIIPFVTHCAVNHLTMKGSTDRSAAKDLQKLKMQTSRRKSAVDAKASTVVLGRKIQSEQNQMDERESLDMPELKVAILGEDETGLAIKQDIQISRERRAAIAPIEESETEANTSTGSNKPAEEAEKSLDMSQLEVASLDRDGAGLEIKQVSRNTIQISRKGKAIARKRSITPKQKGETETNTVMKREFIRGQDSPEQEFLVRQVFKEKDPVSKQMQESTDGKPVKRPELEASSLGCAGTGLEVKQDIKISRKRRASSRKRSVAPKQRTGTEVNTGVEEASNGRDSSEQHLIKQVPQVRDQARNGRRSVMLERYNDQEKGAEDVSVKPEEIKKWFDEWKNEKHHRSDSFWEAITE